MPKTGMRKLAAPAADQSRARIWRSMRVLRSFTRDDLVASAEANYKTVSGYVTALTAAGYVAALGPHTRKAGASQGLRLVRDTGPVAPRLVPEGIYDANLADPYREPPTRRLCRHAPALLKVVREFIDAHDRGQPLPIEVARLAVRRVEEDLR